MTLPKFKVEISFVSAPFSVAPTFVDVSTDVRLNPGITITHGRDDRYSQVQAGTASFTLDNRTGDYTPDNTGGSHYPNMVIGRAIRITASEDNFATSYPRFYGFIDTITVGWDTSNASMAVAQITCVDMFKMLSRQHLADNIIAQAMTEPGTPNEWWTFSDPEGTITPYNGGSTPSAIQPWANAGFTGTITFGNATGPGTDDLTAVEVHQLGFRQTGPATAYTPTTTAGGMTISAFVRADSFDLINSSFAIMSMFDEFNDYIILYVPSGNGGSPQLAVNNLSGGGFVNNTTNGAIPNVCDGRLHHVACTLTSTTTPLTTGLIYVDGVFVGNFGVGAGVTQSFPVWSVGVDQGASSTTNTYTIAHVALWQDTLTAAEIKSISDAGLNGYSPESSAARATRIAQFGFNITPTIIGTPGTGNMAPLTDVAGKSVLDLLQTVSDTENGILYVDRAGALTLKSRLALYDQATALSLPADTYDPGLSFLQDDSLLLNDVTTTAAGSNVPQRYTDATSQSNYGDIAQQFTIESIDDTEALAYSQWRVGTGKPTTRAPQIGIDLMTQQTTQPTLLANFWQLDLGELIAVSGLPTAAPGSTVSLQCQGVTESLTEDSYDAVINTTAAPFLAWKLQDSTYGVLNSTTVLAF